MKYQCTVCGQIIDRNDVCPICGSDSNKIITLNDSEEQSITYRCLSCGRIFEDKDLCPFCGGEELFDLTNDKIFNRNMNNPTKPAVDLTHIPTKEELESEQEEVKEEPVDILASFQEPDEVFPEKEIVIDTPKKVEVKEEIKEEDPTLIIEDPFANSDIIKEEPVKEEPLFVKSLDEEESKEELVKEEVPVQNDIVEHVLETKVEEEKDESLLDLKLNRLDLTKDLIIKLFVMDEENLDDEEKDRLHYLLHHEIEILKKLDSNFDNVTVDDILETKNQLNETIFEKEKDPFNGHVLFLEKEVSKK